MRPIGVIRKGIAIRQDTVDPIRSDGVIRHAALQGST